jgi:oligopeptide/dipeptide ABC transporter ATP-binding protein
MTRLLEAEDLRVSFRHKEGDALAVRGVDLHVDEGESLGIVGESGSGKSVTSLALMGLLQSPPAEIESVMLKYDGIDLAHASKRVLQDLRGKGMAMVFQEPMTSLDPVFTVGNQLAEPLMLHLGMSRRQADARSAELLARVEIPDPAGVMGSYPHQLSGGMRQRVMIAMAISCKPKLLIADEPTTALDVTIQAQIFELIRTIRKQDTALLLITHNMGVVRENCTRTAVMYAGEIVETAATPALFRHPIHPYTEALMAAIPRLAGPTRKRLPTLPGQVPSAGKLPAGCRFCARCSIAIARCAAEHPQMEEAAPGRFVRCWRAAERLPPNLAGGPP